MASQDFIYPDAVIPENVGKHPASSQAGGGYVWDEVLEYRVWCYPRNGAADIEDGCDYYYAFVTFLEAKAFAEATKGANDPLALILQQDVRIKLPGQMRVTNDSFAPLAATRASLLAVGQRLRLVISVNYFGSIKIDSTLLKLRDKDTVELTNGCICCTISGNQFYAIGDTLDRRLRPDHEIVEATGISILWFPKHS